MLPQDASLRRIAHLERKAASQDGSLQRIADLEEKAAAQQQHIQARLCSSLNITPYIVSYAD